MEQKIENAAKQNTAAFFSLVSHPLKFRLYLLKNLPSAFFSGLRVVEANSDACIVSVSYKWFTRNPFRSTYFACLSMAAELSTGILAMAGLYGQKVAVSMLVTGIEGKFYKKAKEETFFTCRDGAKICQAISESVTIRQSQEVKAHSVGITVNGEVVSEFWITWSFKAK